MKKCFIKIVVAFALLLGAPGFGHAALTDGLVAHYTFDDCSAQDSVGGLDGVFIGSPSCMDGVQGKALSLLNGYIKMPKLDALWSAGFTFSAWINPSSGTGYVERKLFEMSNGVVFNVGINITPYRSKTDFVQWETGKLYSKTSTSSYSVTPFCTKPPYYNGNRFTQPAGTWTHWCVVIDNVSNTMTFFVDGVRVGGRAGNMENVARDYCVIGANWQGQNIFPGSIDEVRLYNRPLDPTEVVQLRNLEAPLIGQINDAIHGNVQVTCKNNRTLQKVSFTAAPGNWDCTGKGLKLDPGDSVTLTIKGIKD